MNTVVFLLTISFFAFIHIRRLMENLLCYLSNAVKYTPSGTVMVSCTVNSEGKHKIDGKDLKYMQIAVEDEGIGVIGDINAKLFLPLQQTARCSGGTGLGLFSVAKRVEALKGHYGVSSREDGKTGSRFWFSIPYNVDDTFVFALSKSGWENTSMSQRDILGSTGVEATALSALVVEDSLVVSKATSRMLTKAGYKVECVFNGAAGLEKMKKNHYDVVLMDIQMPIMDGIEATKHYRSYESWQNNENNKNARNWRRQPQVIIGVSANEYEGFVEEVLASGMNAFIPKPFSLQKLIDWQQGQKNPYLCYRSNSFDSSV
jgi:CheY-like chemotaxis protein